MQVPPDDTEIKRKSSLDNFVESAGAAMQRVGSGAGEAMQRVVSPLREKLSPEKAGDLLGVLGAAPPPPPRKKDAETTIDEEPAAPAEPSGGLPALILAICTCKMPFR